MKNVLKEFAKDLVAEARRIMDSDIGINSKVGKNTLSGSDLYKDLDFEITDDGNINLRFNYYVSFIEFDRPPKYKKRPPVDAILAWMTKKHIVKKNTDVKKLRRIAFAISYGIWRDGHKGRKIFETLFENSDKLFEDNGYKIFEKITEDLENWFDT